MDELNDFEYNDGWTINFKKVSEDNELLAITRLLARDLMVVPYMSVGDFFKKLSDKDLDTLLELVNDDDDDSEAEILLLSEMLARAEGSETDDLEQVARNMAIFKILVAGTSLHRKEMVKAHFDKYSFGEDMLTEIVFEKV